MRLVFPRAETRRILRPDTRGLKEPHLLNMHSLCIYSNRSNKPWFGKSLHPVHAYVQRPSLRSNRVSAVAWKSESKWIKCRDTERKRERERMKEGEGAVAWQTRHQTGGRAKLHDVLRRRKDRKRRRRRTEPGCTPGWHFSTRLSFYLSFSNNHWQQDITGLNHVPSV